jgi:hypothetical protein
MAYEYGSSAQRLDFPNPFRVENVFRFIAAAILIGGGLMAVFEGRTGLYAHIGGWALAPIIVGVAMLAAGIQHAAVGLSRLRFFFGRGKPAGLAGELADAQLGELGGAAALKSTIRGGAISVDEPAGALNGLLYSLVRPLIWAPQRIQWVAQRLFHTGLTLAVLLLALLVSLLGVSGEKDMAWLGLFFFIYAAALLLKPLESGDRTTTRLGSSGLIALILVAILAPVLIHAVSATLPSLGGVNLSGQALLLLLCALASVLVFFVAVLRQMVAPPQTTMACELATVSMNAPPNQILVELDREMQRGWIEQIPNRRYARYVPQTVGDTGTFHGELLEETQPMPRDDMRTVNFAHALAEPRYRWLTVLSALGVIYTVAGSIALLLFTHQVTLGQLAPTLWQYVCFAGGMFSLALFCLRAGHILWARFDFVSRMTWVEIDGTFQRSHTAVGAPFTDRVRTEKDIVSVNDMTLRVWVAEVDSVTFGSESERRIVGLRGLTDRASALRKQLESFAADQSSVDMPTSRRDVEKIAALGAMNQLGGTPPAPEALLKAMGGASVATSGTQSASSKSPAFCPACGAAALPGARFCASCGRSLITV